MLKIRYKILLIIALLNFPLCATQIHIIGDSHGSFCFSNNPSTTPSNEHSFFEYDHNNRCQKVQFHINCFVSKTMYSVGRDGLNGINLKNFDVKEDDVAVFVFGEIDARCHIGKQRDTKNLNLDEVIESLAQSFMTTIQKNKSQFHNLYCVIA